MLKYTLSRGRRSAGIGFDLTVEDDVLPFDWADMSQQVMTEWEVRRGQHTRDSPDLPTDNARIEDKRQERTTLHLVVDSRN